MLESIALCSKACFFVPHVSWQTIIFLDQKEKGEMQLNLVFWKLNKTFQMFELNDRLALFVQRWWPMKDVQNNEYLILESL